MTKRTIWAIAAVFIAWSAMDFLLHGVLLRSTYEATSDLWRPMDEMKMPLMRLVTLAFAACFTVIYQYVEPKSLTAGVRYGALFGLATGLSMGFGSYSYMPIPLSLAWSWFLGSWLELTVAGALVGTILKP